MAAKTRSFIAVPRVEARPARPLYPEAQDGLSPVAAALLARQQADRLARAEEKSLSPLYLDDVKARLAAERAVEEALARGRAKTRREVRKATDLSRFGRDRASVRFPDAECLGCAPLRMVAYGFAAMVAPFVLYFVFAAVI